MSSYADTSFLARIYTPHADSDKAIRLMAHMTEPLSFTPFHRHELRNALRLRVYRAEITEEQRKQAFGEVESDLVENILVHTPIPWTDTFREADNLGAIHTAKLGARSFDLLHVALARVLKASAFLTFDSRIGSGLTAAEEEAVVRSLDEAMRDVDAGKGVPIEDVRKLVRSSTFCVTGMVGAARPI